MTTFAELQQKVKSLPINAPDMLSDLTYHLTGLSNAAAKIGRMCEMAKSSEETPFEMGALKTEIGTSLIILASLANAKGLELGDCASSGLEEF